MDYRKFNVDTWKSLDESGNSATGYKSCWLALNDEEESGLHIFKDRTNQYHYTVEVKEVNKTGLVDPQVYGLQVNLASYRFENGSVSQFIDLTCNISGYLEEFTEVVKEISKLILEDEEKPLNAVNLIINNWISFWKNKRKEMLSEEEQIGLICELIVLDKLCEINKINALNTWTGPLGEKHDFNFSEWTFEVKGTINAIRSHTINGIDQLKPVDNKNFAFISFKMITASNMNSLNLPDFINSLADSHFNNEPHLIRKFYELLSFVGYSPVHEEEYRKFNIEVLDSILIKVDNEFPKLTSGMMAEPLNSRISSVRYDINLEGMKGKNLDNIGFDKYFY